MNETRQVQYRIAEQWMSGSTVLETFSYSYNADGQLTSANNPDSAYAYDGMGRVSSVDNNGTPNVPDVVLSSQYDANSNRTQLSATIAGTADFQNVYTYDALNRLTQLYQQGQTGGNAVAVKGANITYNLLGQLATITRTNFFGVGPAPDIATSTFSYDDANRLTEIANTTNGGTAIDAYSWTYDNANRVTSMTTTTDGAATYSYDNTDQVTGATYTTNLGATQPANESYSYDSNGNRTNTGYSTGTNNQLSSDGTFNYTYDNEGNRITRTRISNDPANDYKTTYTWDYRDRLTDVEFYNNSNVLTKHVHYTYDVFDHLIGKQVDDTGGGTYDRAEFYAYDGNNVVLQFNASGTLTERYINGPNASGVDTVLAEEDVTSLTSPGNVTWPLSDNLGTVRDIVDSSGAVIDHLVYNSFGQVAYESAATVHHLEGYAGSIYDPDTGMTNNWHRWYDPAAGRFISEDPISADVNLSRYTHNDPLNATDPTGLDLIRVTTTYTFLRIDRAVLFDPPPTANRFGLTQAEVDRRVENAIDRWLRSSRHTITTTREWGCDGRKGQKIWDNTTRRVSEGTFTVYVQLYQNFPRGYVHVRFIVGRNQITDPNNMGTLFITGKVLVTERVQIWKCLPLLFDNIHRRFW